MLKDRRYDNLQIDFKWQNNGIQYGHFYYHFENRPLNTIVHPLLDQLDQVKILLVRKYSKWSICLPWFPS